MTGVDLATVLSSDEYQRRAAARRYTLWCHHFIGGRRVRRVIARGLAWADVKALSGKMQARECARPGYRGSWSGRLFIPELER